MSHWKLINKTYLYDGTFDGLLTIVFECYCKKTLPKSIYKASNYEQNFLDNIITIETDYEKSQRVFYGIEKNICKQALYNSYYAFLCEEKDKEINLLKYICTGFDTGPEINNMLTLSYVFKVINMKKRAFGENHRLKGLLRFQEIGENLYYSSIHPDNNILEPLGQHFIRRFPTQNFFIHDKIRNLCFIYNCKEYQIIDSTNIKIPNISENEQKYQELWKLFFNTISIKERNNPKCQRQFMPKKYWKDLIEEP